MATNEADPNYDPLKDPKRKAKSSDPGWKYGFWPDLNNKMRPAHTLNFLFFALLSVLFMSISQITPGTWISSWKLDNGSVFQVALRLTSSNGHMMVAIL